MVQLDATEFRRKRIERLLEELRVEVTRGILEDEIDERLGFSFMVPCSRIFPKRGVVWVQFEAYPLENAALCGQRPQGLRLVKSEWGASREKDDAPPR